MVNQEQKNKLLYPLENKFGVWLSWMKLILTCVLSMNAVTFSPQHCATHQFPIEQYNIWTDGIFGPTNSEKNKCDNVISNPWTYFRAVSGNKWSTLFFPPLGLFVCTFEVSCVFKSHFAKINQSSSHVTIPGRGTKPFCALTCFISYHKLLLYSPNHLPNLPVFGPVSHNDSFLAALCLMNKCAQTHGSL